VELWIPSLGMQVDMRRTKSFRKKFALTGATLSFSVQATTGIQNIAMMANQIVPRLDLRYIICIK